MPLSDLASALAAATGPSRELDERIATEVFGWRPHPDNPVRWKMPGHEFYIIAEAPAYTRSLDAITGAVRARWSFVIIEMADSPFLSSASVHPRRSSGVRACIERPGCPALALSLAAVRLALSESTQPKEA